MKPVLIIFLFTILHKTVFTQATLSGRVYNDIVTVNNTYDPGEGLNNITVWLFDLNATAPFYRVHPIASTTTDANGNYVFTTLAPGDYQVRVVQFTIPSTITRAVADNDSYPNGLTNVTGVTGTNTYTGIDFGFAPTAVPPSFTSVRYFQWNATNTFINQTSQTYNLTPETIGAITIVPTITWSTDRQNTPGGGYGANIYPQASDPSAILGQDFPGNNKGGLHPLDNTFQLIYGDASYNPVNNDRQTTTIQFSVPVFNTRFSIYDTDHADPQRATGRIDHVKVTGFYGGVPVFPVIENPSATPWNTVSGNTVYGFASYPLSNYTVAYNSQNQDNATVNVYFQNTIDRIEVEYEEWAPVMLPGKGIQGAEPANDPTLTDENLWVNRLSPNAPTHRGIAISGIDYTVDAAAILLPIRLKEFTVSQANCEVVCRWETAYEEQLKAFFIEYAAIGIQFKTIGTIPAKNYATGSSYRFSVPAAFSKGYYRLKTEEENGTIQYSDIRFLPKTCNNGIAFTIMPNPVKKGSPLSIRINKSTAGSFIGILMVRDLDGKLILQRSLFLNQTDALLEIPTGSLKPGAYLLGLYDAQQELTGTMQQVIIQ